MCADAPNPYTPSRPPGRTPLRRSARYPMMPAHNRGAAVSSSKPSGSGYAYRSSTTAAVRVAAVVVPSRETRAEAQVLVAALTEATQTTGAAQPRDARRDRRSEIATPPHRACPPGRRSRDPGRRGCGEARGRLRPGGDRSGRRRRRSPAARTSPAAGIGGSRSTSLRGFCSMGPGASTTQARTGQPPPGTICGGVGRSRRDVR